MFTIVFVIFKKHGHIGGSSMLLTKGLLRPVDCCTIVCGQQGLGHYQQLAIATGREWSATLYTMNFG